MVFCVGIIELKGDLKLTDGQFERRSSLVNRISLVEADNACGYFESLFSNILCGNLIIYRPV